MMMNVMMLLFHLSMSVNAANDTITVEEVF
jgi:hypothetical protein